MGGNALKNTKTRRYARDDYIALREEVIGKLLAHPTFAGRRINDILSYANKDSFGDMDLLLESDNLKPTVWDDLTGLFNPNEFVRNGPVSSFDYKELQIDVLMQAARTYEMAAVYFAYNDLGNLMGRVAYKLGFKYGHDGLTYIPRSESGDPVREIPLSSDYREIFKFLGYDHKVWEAGFADLESIYKFTVMSPYFNREYYRLETRSHAARMRDKKRATYSGFLIWLESQPDVPEYDFTNARDVHLARAKATFPGFTEELASAWESHRLHMIAKTRFNGSLVAEATGLNGNALGQWIQGFKHQWPGNDAFATWITSSTDSEIKTRVRDDFISGKVVMREKVEPLFSRDNVRNWTGLGGSSLQQFMTMFKQNWLDETNFKQWLETQTKETLEIEIRRRAEKFTLPNQSTM